MKQYQIGQQLLQNWKIEHIQTHYKDFPQFQTILLRHLKSNAQYFHIACPQEQNNSFCINFKTLPPNSSGMAHILEHTTLCGSKKFPVRDLFFNMISRSLNTYMNAWTAPDATSYPYSTQNEKDFYNLMQVYCDACFYPLLSKEHFLQEGYRLELDTSSAAKEELSIKGVVYNEMKGAMSDPSQFYYHQLMQHLLPGTYYEVNSGGEPLEIPKLTYEELLHFHHTFYHPSNAKFFSYGNFDLEKHLEFLNQNVLQDKWDSTIPKPVPEKKLIRFSEPRHVHIYGPVDPFTMDPNKQAKYSISFAVLEQETAKDAYESFAMTFLCNLLLDDPRGALYKALIESGVAPDFSPGTGYESSLKYTIFSIGVQNIAEDQVAQVDQIIFDTLKKVCQEGVEQSLIDAHLHHVELSLKTKSANFGIHLCSPILSQWNNYGNPMDSLQVSEKLDHIKEELRQGIFFKRIETYFLNNSHRLHLLMSPNPQYNTQQQELEQQLIQNLQSKLTTQDRERIQLETQLLKQSQTEEPTAAKEKLPTLTIQDIPKQIPERIELTEIAPQIFFNPQVTNGITYISMVLRFDSLETIPQELLPYLSTFTSILTKIGAAEMDHRQLAESIDLFTGGISATHHVIPDIHKTNSLQLAVDLSSYCLERNVEKMIQLMSKILLHPKLINGDLQYMKSLINQMAVSVSSDIIDSGHVYASIKANSYLTKLDSIQETTGGYNHVKFLNEMCQQESIDSVAQKLSQLSQLLLHQKVRMSYLITAENESVAQHMVNHIQHYLTSDTVSKKNTFESFTFVPTFANHFISVPSTVNFTSQSLLSAPFATKDAALLRLASPLINAKFLHKQVREMGGAYGSNASQTPNGLFVFTSYRDPNIRNTIGKYNQVLDWVNLHGAFDHKDVEEAKLQTFQAIDAPLTPHKKAISQFIYGITEELRQERRTTILEATKVAIQEVCNKYLSTKQRSNVVLGNVEQFKGEQVTAEEQPWEMIQQPPPQEIKQEEPKQEQQ